ncbi:MAG: tRNA (adenosine(37)-N6)-threonylcarbamoyltransferase complex ATPase subunit type 1 TsaE [Deltaproteobacteria bacterium]|nr:tRNA (adenosine(37)-N6)-threonylcarbamoyltransferase complex ATPase subunit type 1 TsaE [Deltaproteobacteria bacterium]
MTSFDLISKGPEDTLDIGRIIGECLTGGDVVALTGELGAGKTCLTQGIAMGLDIPEGYYVTSPTFTLINEYPGRISLYHMDVYRLSSSLDLEDMGYQEYFYGDGVVVIEWAEKVDDIIPAEALFINLEHCNGNKRKIRISRESGMSSIIRMLKKEDFNTWL